MSDSETSYAAGHAEGLREGRIISLEDAREIHSKRLDSVEGKLSSLEKVGYILMGSIAMVNFAPALKEFFG